MSDQDQEAHSLDIVCILLSLISKPININFDSGPFSVSDYRGHVYSIMVNNGKGIIQSGSVSSLNDSDNSEQINSPGSDNETIENYHETLKTHVEGVLDINITNFNLSWTIKDNKICLLSTNDSQFQSHCSISQIASQMPTIALCYAQELSVNVIAGECITRGQTCCGFSQTIPLSKVVNYHIFQMVNSFGLDYSESQTAHNYIKRRLTSISPALMMLSVPVCSNCFKLFTAELKFKQSRPNTSMTKTRSSYSTRPQTASPQRGRAPPVARPEEPLKKGSLTQSGLIITSDIALRSFNIAKQMYKNVPFPPRRPIVPKQPKKNEHSTC